MSIDNPQKFRDLFASFFAADMTAAGLAMADSFLNQEFRYASQQPLDASINTVTTHTLDQNTVTQFRVKTFKFSATSNIASANTNVATIALVYNNGAGGSDTTIASTNTATTAGGGTGDIVAGVAYSFSCNANNVVVPINSQLQVKITKAGAGGCALPAGTFEVKAVPA